VRVTVINGSERKESTYHCTKTFLNEISKFEGVEKEEFFFPKDMPYFCKGCFSCFYNGENTCPHNESVTPIVKSILNADLLIITSPVYAMDVSGQLKALLDHLCFMWFSHRPNPKMFGKIAVTISTTAGAGLSHTTKTIKNSLNFWGVKRVFSYKYPVSASRWNEVTLNKKLKIEKEIARLAKSVHKAVNNSEKLPSPIFRSFIFFIMKGLMKKNTWNPKDRQHWVDNGWV